MSTTANLKQACLDISEAAMAIFDHLDAHDGPDPEKDLAVVAHVHHLVQNTNLVLESFRARAVGALLRRWAP